jgi:hypothetical protein
VKPAPEHHLLGIPNRCIVGLMLFVIDIEYDYLVAVGGLKVAGRPMHSLRIARCEGQLIIAGVQTLESYPAGFC